MPVDIYLMDSLKISVPYEHEEIIEKWMHARETGDPVITLDKPELTTFAVDKISAVVNKPRGISVVPQPEGMN